MSREAMPEIIITKDSIAFLKRSIYAIEIAQTFIVDLMNLFLTYKDLKKTESEHALFNELKNIELANALVWKCRTDPNFTGEVTATALGASIEATPALEKPTLYFVSEGEVESAYSKIITSFSETRELTAQDVEGRIISTLKNYKQLDDAAKQIASEHIVNKKSWRTRSKSTMLTTAIHAMITVHYKRAVLIEQISMMNDIQTSNTAIYEFVKKALRKEQEKMEVLEDRVNAKEKENEALNATVADLRNEFAATKGENEALNATVADLRREFAETKRGNEALNATFADLRRDFAKTKGENEVLNATVDALRTALDETNSKMFHMGTFHRSIQSVHDLSILAQNNKYVNKIKKIWNGQHEQRWACIVYAVNAYSNNTMLADVDEPFIELLKTLLHESPEDSTEDHIIESWLDKYNDDISTFLKENLLKYKTLPPLQISPDKKGLYYQAIAKCFEKGGFFPKLRDVADEFNALRPSKQRLRAEEEAAVGDVTSTVASAAAPVDFGF